MAKRRKIMDVENLLTKEDFQESPIQKLDLDSLILIFQKLPIADLARIERVSKSWQEMAKLSWSSIKKLTLTPKFLGLRPVGTRHAYKDITSAAFEKILEKCGKKLVEIDALYIEFDVSPLIAKHCKNIQSINCFKVSVEGVLGIYWQGFMGFYF